MPEPCFYQELDIPIAESDVDAAASPAWRLTVRPDIAALVATPGTTPAATVFIIAPARAAAAAAARCYAWRHDRGAAEVLPEVSDAATVAWGGAAEGWQLLSPVFGVLALRDSAGGGARLPVAPLLDAAIARRLAGVLGAPIACGQKLRN